MARKDELSESAEPEESERGQPWSDHEVALIVADYFEMLLAELSGEAYSKAGHKKDLRPKLNNCSKSSVEYKHQNISGVLIGMGLPYINGYKPAKHIQKSLSQALGEYLVRHPEFFDKLVEGPVLNPTQCPSIGDRPVGEYFESPPEAIIVPAGDDKPWLSRGGRKIDFARRDAFNRQFGQLGEQFAVEIERHLIIIVTCLCMYSVVTNC